MENSILFSYKTPNYKNTEVVSKELPALSFVPFEAYKLKKPKLVWINEDLISSFGLDIEVAEKQILDNFSYVTEDYTIQANIKKNDSKHFLADRYGSRYEVCNGGSARCGINGNFQIKGIGKNPLIASNMGYNHSHGKMFLDEAVNEAIWGEICHRHLPYGAVRTVAIIKTNTRAEFGYGQGQVKHKDCALAIREIAIRPAHFERATFFWPSKKEHYLRDNDAMRVKHTAPFVERAFGVTKEDKEKYGSHVLFCALMCFVERIAIQIATSRVKGIPHGSLTSSNIALDGRFLDFGTITAVPDFANYVLASGQGGVWDDHLLIVDWLDNLIFTLNKYSEEKVSNEQKIEILDFFAKHLDDTENIELTRRLGIKSEYQQQLKIGAMFKRNLRVNNKNREPLGYFNVDKFLTDIKSTSEMLSIDTPNVDFELRQFKYSRFTIDTNEMVKKTGGSRDSISKLISNYYY